jgi:GR25 family glycosyltransferase involved in LPS biosynthesis
MSITQGHLGLFKEAVMSGADTIVIFEDDSDFSNFTIQAKQLIDVIENSQKSRNSEVFVDVSVSFSWESLGVTHLFDTACNENFMKKGSPSIMRARKPVTNTTSAVLYNKTILISLIPFLEEKTRNRFFQFVPFDHLINLYFVMQKGASKSIDCFHVVPGIFPQLSLSSRR